MIANINKSEEDVIFKRFHGATSEEIAFYAHKPLSDTKAEKVIVIAGTNDLTNAVYQHRGYVNELEITKNILKIGRAAKDHGAQKIFISGVMVRWGHQYRNAITRVNNFLQSRCSDEGFLFMDQGDITTAHISGDGIHLNYHGTTVLKMNLLLTFNSFNPYICTFDEEYDNAII